MHVQEKQNTYSIDKQYRKDFGILYNIAIP